MTSLSERNAASIIAALGGKNGICKCPAHSDSKPSLHVREKDGRVLVKCHAGCSQNAVIMELRARGLWPDAKSWAAPLHTTPAESCDEEEFGEYERLRAAFAILRTAARTNAGKPIAYFKGRGIDAVPDSAMILTAKATRSLSGRELWRGGPSIKLAHSGFPAAVFPIVNRKGKLTAVQITWLTKDLSSKLGTNHAQRQTIGPAKGGYVQLAEPDPTKPLIIGEGIETTAACMQIAGCPGIAALGKGNIKNIDPPACTEIIVAADNDEHNGGLEAAKEAAQKWTREGHVVRIAMPRDIGQDWNDVLESGAETTPLRRSILDAPSFDPPDVSTSEALEVQLNEIAKLSALEYEQQRKALARELDMRPHVLDREIEKRREVNTAAPDFLAPTEPWAHEVDGDNLLAELRSTLNRYLVLPKGSSTAIALWIIHAHSHDAATHSPILTISSPTKRCGKTTLLRLLSNLVPKPLSAANLTPAVVFRTIEKYYPTLLVDEADTFIKNDPTLRGVLNSGHERTQARIIRTVGDDHEPKLFSTWAPKAIALIGRMHPTLEDRSIKVELKRKLPDKTIERLPRGPDTFSELRRKAARWAIDNLPKLRTATPNSPKELHDRARDNWDALLAIADECGGDWPHLARESAIALSGEDDDQSHAILLLRDLKDMFERYGRNLSSQEIADELRELEERPWPEFNRGHPITAHGIAKLLADFKIRPKQVRVRGQQVQGYQLQQFEFAFGRYLPRTLSQTSDTSDNSTNSNVSSNDGALTGARRSWRLSD